MEPLDRIIQEIESLGLRREAEEALGAEFSREGAFPLELEDDDWGDPEAWDRAPSTTHMEHLRRDGVPLRPPRT